LSGLDRPRIRVDFNELVGQDLVPLAAVDQVEDSRGQRIFLRRGLPVHLYMDDADEGGKPTYLLASGTVEKHQASDWSAKARWRCRIDQWRQIPR
jgi:hypothetical protein